MLVGTQIIKNRRSSRPKLRRLSALKPAAGAHVRCTSAAVGTDPPPLVFLQEVAASQQIPQIWDPKVIRTSLFGTI